MTEDGRVILATSSKKVARRRMKFVERTLEAFDELMSPPTGRAPTRSSAAPPGASGTTSSTRCRSFSSRSARPASTRTSCRAWARPARTSNLVHVHGMRPGFSEEQVTAAVLQEAPTATSYTVWRSENELVNRLARLLVFRSYGPQPTWLSVGAAWNIELEVMRDIYCFYRAGFVGIGDHGGWETELKREFKKRKKDPLALDEFAGWRRNTWDEHKAQLAFGMVEYLSRHEPEVLPRRRGLPAAVQGGLQDDPPRRPGDEPGLPGPGREAAGRARRRLGRGAPRPRHRVHDPLEPLPARRRRRGSE